MIRFNKPTIKRKDMDSVLQTLVNEQIGSGEQEKEFMNAFASSVSCTDAVGYRTYPDCIKASLLISGATSETVVAMSPLAPAVYVEIAEKMGCKVVFVDVSRETGLPEEEAVAESGASILVLYENCGSLPLKYDEVENRPLPCSYSNITVIEDVSESLGSLFGEYRPGMWGNVVVCSFEQDNVVSAGGGAALAVKAIMAETLKGFVPDNYIRMTDMGAALGKIQLENLEENCLKCREIFDMYSNGVRTTQNRVFGVNYLGFKPNGGSFSVFMNCKTDDIIEFAKKRNVPVVKTFADSAAKNSDQVLFETCPVAASFYHRTISFPIYPFLKAADIDLISKIIAHLP